MFVNLNHQTSREINGCPLSEADALFARSSYQFEALVKFAICMYSCKTYSYLKMSPT